MRVEFETGQKLLAELEQKRDGLQQALVRFSGAIQVLDELLAAAQPSPNGVQAPPPVSLSMNDSEHA